jgi:hypothetical protein
MASTSISSKSAPLYSICFARHRFQIRDQFPDRFPSVGFDHSDHHIFAAGVPPDRFGQHGMGLAHAGSVSKKELEPASLLRRRTFSSHCSGVLGIAIIVVETLKGFKASSEGQRSKVGLRR